MITTTLLLWIGKCTKRACFIVFFAKIQSSWPNNAGLNRCEDFPRQRGTKMSYFWENARAGGLDIPRKWPRVFRSARLASTLVFPKLPILLDCPLYLP